MKRMTYIIAWLLCIVWLCSACGRLELRRMEGVVAECHGKILTERDMNALTKGMAAEDSMRIAEQYIREWCINLQMEKAIAGGARSLLIRDDRADEIERMVAQYRKSLYEHEWERGLVAREMSQLVEDSVVLAYYEQHKAAFRLRETIFKGMLLVVPNGAPGLDKLKKEIAKLKAEEDNAEVLEQVEKYAYQYANGYELFLDEWRTTNQVLTRMPFEEDNLHKLLRQKRQLSMQDSLYSYVLQVTEMHPRGEQMPLDHARGEIEEILLRQRQVEFIQQKREELYKSAIEQGKLKLYEK